MPAEFEVSCTPVAGATILANDPTKGKTVNVSREGMLLTLDGPVEPSTLSVVQVALRSAQMPLQVVGESRWMHAGQDRDLYQVGLAFVGLPAHVSERWAGEI